MRTIEVIVKGEQENKELALHGLMRDTSYSTIKKVINDLPIDKVIQIAQVCHGIMYREIRGF